MHHSDWLLAIIIKIKPSPDRVAPMFKVKTANAEYVRPAGDLCLIEDSSFYNNNE